MRWCSWLVGCCLMIGVCCAWAQAPDLERMDFILRSVPDGPVARVNGVSVPSGDFRRLYVTELASWAMQAHDKDVPNTVRMETAVRCLRLLIQREILFQEAQKRKTTVPETELEQAWKEEMQRVSRSIGKDPDTPATEEDVLKWAGLSREEALNSVRRDMVIEKVRDAITKEKGVKVTEAEMREFFKEQQQLFKRADKCHLKQIFIGFGPQVPSVDETRKLRAREKMDTAIRRIRAGESFESVAKAMSEAPDAEKGGDMGMLALNALPPFFADAAYKLQPGQMSDVIESALGVHLIQLVGFEAGAEPGFEKDKTIIEKMLLTRKSNEVIEDFCKPVLDAEGAVQVYLALDKTLDTFPGIKEEIQRAAQGSSSGASRP